MEDGTGLVIFNSYPEEKLTDKLIFPLEEEVKPLIKLTHVTRFIFYLYTHL